jgi:hypothetical protein
VYFAYIDESGNTGIPPKGSRTYTLGCVLLDAAEWPATFDEMIDYRRFLRARFGIPVRAELKANHLLRNSGAFRPLALSESARRAVYRQTMRIVPKLGLSAFAVVIDKTLRTNVDHRSIAWEFMLQRLERFSTKGGVPLMIVHDEGEATLVRKYVRKARRAGMAGSMFGSGILKVPARFFVDDPVARDSSQSYFVQVADLVAYAAFRKHFPPPQRPVNIVDSSTWDELGVAALSKVNMYSGGPPGIVLGG